MWIKTNMKKHAHTYKILFIYIKMNTYIGTNAYEHIQ